MKNSLTIRLFLFLFSFAMFTNCSKKDDITPANIADKIAGSYVITQVDKTTLPYNQGGNQINGTMLITKISTTRISIEFIINIISNGQTTKDTDSGQVDIKQNGNTIDLIDPDDGTTKVGNFANNILTIDTGNTLIIGKKN
jgi:hypothetical protein